jgi:hypothetical protein
MNHDCNGDFYSVDGKRSYRCLYDGAVVAAVGLRNGVACPECRRTIADTQEHGALPVRHTLVTEVNVPGFGWCSHGRTVQQ